MISFSWGKIEEGEYFASEVLPMGCLNNVWKLYLMDQKKLIPGNSASQTFNKGQQRASMKYKLLKFSMILFSKFRNP